MENAISYAPNIPRDQVDFCLLVRMTNVNHEAYPRIPETYQASGWGMSKNFNHRYQKMAPRYINKTSTILKDI